MNVLFNLSGLIVLPAWLALLVLPFWWPGVTRITKLLVPGLLAVAYLVLITLFWGEKAGGFGSLAEIRAMFGHNGLLLAGWLHYLAFDLFIGSWIVDRAHRLGIRHESILPCLPLTFMFGPIGLLLYFCIEGIWRARAKRREITA